LSALALRPVHRQHQERVEHDEQNQRQDDKHQACEPVEDRAVRVQFAQFGQLHCHAGRLQQIEFGRKSVWLKRAENKNAIRTQL